MTKEEELKEYRNAFAACLKEIGLTFEDVALDTMARHLHRRIRLYPTDIEEVAALRKELAEYKAIIG